MDGRHKSGRDDRRHDSRRGHGHGHGHQSNTSTQRDRERDRERDRDRDRGRDRDKEREKDNSEQREVEKEKVKVIEKPSGLSIRGASASTTQPLNEFGQGIRREDDRATKRRK